MISTALLALFLIADVPRVCSERVANAEQAHRLIILIGGPMTRTDEGRARRGFAAMDAERQREIARKGGKSVRPENRTYSKDPQIAAAAGRKGGMKSKRD